LSTTIFKGPITFSVVLDLLDKGYFQDRNPGFSKTKKKRKEKRNLTVP